MKENTTTTTTTTSSTVSSSSSSAHSRTGGVVGLLCGGPGPVPAQLHEILDTWLGLAGTGWDPPGLPTPYSGPHCDISSENMAPTAPSTRHSILEFQIASSHPAPVMYYKLYGCSGSRRRLKSFRKPELQGTTGLLSEQ